MNNLLAENSVWDMIFIAMLFCMVIYIGIVLTKSKKISLGFYIALYLYHIAFTFIYYFSSLHTPVDSNLYYINGIHFITSNFAIGTYFINFLCYLFIKLLDISYLSVFFVFSFVGFYGIIILFLTLKTYFKLQKFRFPFWLLFFLPNMHYWTSMLGKDPIIFFSISLICFCLSSTKQRLLFIFLPMLLIFLVRAYMLLIFVPCIFLTILWKSHIGVFKKYCVLSLIIFGTFLMYKPLLKYIGYNNLSYQVLEKQSNRSDQIYSEGSSINMTSYNFAEKSLTYFFRPFLGEGGGVKNLIIQMENMVLLIMLLYVLIHYRYLVKKKWTSYELFCCLSFFYAFFALPEVVGNNLGGFIRSKIILYPLFFSLFSIIYFRKINIIRLSKTIKKISYENYP